MRRIAAAVGAAAAALLLSACARQEQPTGQVCDLVVVLDHFSISATSASDAALPMVLCVGDACSTPVPDGTQRSALVGGKTMESSRARLHSDGRDRWSVELGDGPRPATMTVRLGPADVPVAVRTLHLSWHRGDPSDPCHHWYTVEPIRIAVP